MVNSTRRNVQINDFEIFSGLVNTCFFCFVIPPLPLRLPRIKPTLHPPVRHLREGSSSRSSLFCTPPS